MLEERIDDPPGPFDLLTARKEGGVAAQHVTDQPLVGLRCGSNTDRKSIPRLTG